MKTTEAEAWMPRVPMAIQDTFHPWHDEHVEELRFLAASMIQARDLGVPCQLVFRGLVNDIWPDVTVPLWQAGRSHYTYRLVASLVTTDAIKSGRYDWDNDGQAQQDNTWRWLNSDIPRQRIELYLRAGESFENATGELEPHWHATHDHSAIELIAALRADNKFMRNAEWSLSDMEPEDDPRPRL